MVATPEALVVALPAGEPFSVNVTILLATGPADVIVSVAEREAVPL